MDMITFVLKSDTEIPLYQQLYAFIKFEIQRGNIVCDAKLPSKRKLSAYLKISQNTIQTAYDQLIEEGYVLSAPRKGFFVCKIDHIMKFGVQKEYETVEKRTHEYIVLYDFSHHGVDRPSFPFAIWRKLSRDVINEYDKELLQRGDSQGYYNLRLGIAAYLHQSRGVNCTADQIVISSGIESLFVLLIQLLDRKNVYGIENPGYEKMNLLFSSNHAKFEAIDIDSNGMKVEEVRKSGANVLCLTPAHQFPSGEIMSINRRAQLLNWANEEEGRYIIEDDYDSEFKYSGKPIPALQGLDGNEKVIYMGAFSKSLAPSIRVSYMVLPSRLMKQYRQSLSFIICPVPMIEQKVLCRFIADGYFERHLNKMRNVYKRKRECLVKNLMEQKCDIEILGADAGLHLLLAVYNGMSEDELVSSAIEAGIKVYGISKYYFKMRNNAGMNRILIGYAAMEESEICNAVNAVCRAWFANKA